MESQKNPDAYFDKQLKFQLQLRELRELAIAAGLKETVKWGIPTYTIDGKNVVGISGFKEHYGIWFFQGGTLKDEHNILKNAQEGKTKAMRQWRFTANDNLDHELIMVYLKEAIENQRKGKVIKPDSKKPLKIPNELIMAFQQNQELENNFESLSLSKKREYAEYIIEAKREETKLKRLEKIIPMINDHVGLSDKYRK